MRLLLVRHAESVDNAAGLYAGTRDSPLTAHGALQARRLADFLARQPAGSPRLAHVFSSPLRRAVMTAEALAEAHNQACDSPKGALDEKALSVVQVPCLRERDFGMREGVSFRARGRAEDATVDEGSAEPVASLRARADAFVDDYLVPLVCDADSDLACAVVAHGIILGVLFRALVDRIPSAELQPGTAPTSLQPYALRHSPPSWSNTGYMDLLVVSAPPRPDGMLGVARPLPLSLTVQCVNCTDHLRRLQKTRGGIGSAAFDERQRTVDSFFASSRP